jgi:hypothetical protein
VRDLRTKIAAVTVALGLGGLGGYAMSSNKAHHAAVAVTPTGTKVIRRTIHVKPHHPKAAPPSHAARTAMASTPVSTGSSGSGYSSGTAVHTGSSGSSGSHTPVHTGSSGSGGSSHVTTGSSGGGGGEREGGGGEGGD